MAGNIVDGDGGRISQIQNLCRLHSATNPSNFFLADTFFASRCIALSYDCFASSTRAVTSPVHDRMPVLLDPDAYDLWFDAGMTNVAAASELEAFRGPADAVLSRNQRINSVVNDDEECSRPVEVAVTQNQLFA